MLSKEAKVRSRYRGSLLIETLVGAALSMVALALSVPLLRWSTQGLHHAQTDAATRATLDHAVEMLRRDVWQAQKVQLTDTRAGNRLVLTSPAGSTIAWRFDRTGVVTRMTSPTDVQFWKSPGSGTGVHSDNGLLILTLPASPPHPAESIALVNPASLYGGPQ
jgi:hypothetical protein